jgi:uncharacterized protein DUF2190
MSQATTLLTLPIKAISTVTAHHVVTYAGAQATTLGEKVLGVNQFDASANETIAVATKGTAIAVLGGTVAVGDPLCVDGSGQTIKATDEALQFVFADALEAGSVGNKVEIQLR